ncbi:hypothetical protein [Oceanobacillus chungangensis]|uniref:Uncharacterized protein n=1 Tax=Oceanobacillus chungangensis TaxID=1229152 RepID=A0A3D8PJA2_9BACI|nr:hypothetical protein [Oceanobacillus chungangensis]RDW16166.1 hypothetical protein CWR45_14910 [Oceanobacillus chungangensis]
MNEIVSILLIVATLALQYLLSSRNNVYLGAIVPILFVAGLTWMLITDRIESILAYVLFLIVGLVFLLQQWSHGRNTLRKNRQRELDKMKTHDIK